MFSSIYKNKTLLSGAAIMAWCMNTALCSAQTVQSPPPPPQDQTHAKSHDHNAAIKKTFQPLAYHGTYKIELDRDAYFDVGIDTITGTSDIKIFLRDGKWVTQSKSSMYVSFKKDSDNDKKTPSRYDVVIESEEGKDSLSYLFNSQSCANSTQDQVHTQGEMKFPTGHHQPHDLDTPQLHDKDKAYIQYVAPEFIRVNIDKDVLFPQQHLHSLIQKALENVLNVTNQKIFDGSNDTPKVMVVDTEITPQDDFKLQTKLNLPHPTDTIKDEATLQNHENAAKLAHEMKNASIWKLKMKFFPTGKRESEEPDYILTQTVNSLGMVLAMRMNYMEPEFTVKITMTDCKLLQLSPPSPARNTP